MEGGLNNIMEARFRANPNYSLTLFDRLPSHQLEMFSELTKDPEFYGILYPREGVHLVVKSVCQTTALLFMTLAEPWHLPGYIRTMFGEQCNQEISKLVLDSILEIEQEGRFVSGSEAYDLIYKQRSNNGSKGVIACLSEEAIKYAQSLDISDAVSLSARIYFFNRRPASPGWRQKFPTAESVVDYLGVGGNGSHSLNRCWTQLNLNPPNDGWLMWKHRASSPEPNGRRLRYKLYLSPACEHAGEAFKSAVPVLERLKTPRFKVFKDVYGLLRPDKIIIYFYDFEALQEASLCLWEALRNCPAHGVPFTAELEGSGLLSWGMDPPSAQRPLQWQERESWRLWITNRLATALLLAKQHGAGSIEPWQFSMERLRLEGVDTDSWLPLDMEWKEA